MPAPDPPTAPLRSVLVVMRDWPQQEDPRRPLLPADAPAVLAGRVVTASAAMPTDGLDLVATLVARAAARGLTLPGPAAAQAVCEHAVRAGAGIAGTVALVAADLGASVLLYALVTPDPPQIPVADRTVEP